MTFLNNGSHAGNGGQVRPEAPEDLLRAMVQRLVQDTIQGEFDQFVGAGSYERKKRDAGGVTALNRGRSRHVSAN